MTPGKCYEITGPRIDDAGRHRRFMDLAKKKALESKFEGPRMSAILVRGGNAYSVGVNKAHSGILKSRHYGKNQAIHAEWDCVAGIDPKILKGATIYVAGVSAKSQNPTWSSFCCPSCQKVMKDCGIKRVIYHDKNWNLYVWNVGINNA